MPSETKPVLPPTRAKVVAAELRREIQRGQIPAGSPLRQVEIAERYGVSTTPVREAFLTLAKEGLVRHDAHRGVIVFAPSVEELREIYEMRAVLEPLATKIAASKMGTDAIEELEGILAKMQNAKAFEYSDLNRQLHTTIYAAAERPRLFATIENLRDAAASYLLIAIERYEPGYMDQAHAEHEEIVRLLVNGTPAQAARAVREHLEHSAEQVTGLISAIDQ